MTELKDIDLSIGALRSAYQTGKLRPKQVLAYVAAKTKQYEQKNIWITLLTDEQLKPYLENLKDKSPADLPLYGIPFAIKDNIDLAGVPTTAACAEFAYTPDASAHVVQRLVDAGAIPIGKTNLDQFATGLVGTRSPYGAVSNAFNDEYIAGGSSSGSAVALALGQVSFSLGTDTAGSGRIPAAFNNLIGLKPTRGRVSTHGVVPACRSLDCVSVFALNPDDLDDVFHAIDDFDEHDSYARGKAVAQKVFHSKLQIGVPEQAQLAFFGNEDFEKRFDAMLQGLTSQGHEITRIDFTPFIEAARLLYEGPWIAERYAAIESFIETNIDALNPVTRAIITPAKNIDAVACFNSFYRLQDLKRQADAILAKVDIVCMPTAGTHYKLDEVAAEPVLFNSNLGYYTNFMNLLDYAAIALPAGFTAAGMPFGISLFSDAHTDRQLIDTARQLLSEGLERSGATSFGWCSEEMSPSALALHEYIDVAVCGAHLSGMPLNWQLTEKKAVLLAKTKTAACYRFYALAGGPPFRPGLIRDEKNGAAIAVEVWRMPINRFGEFMDGIPHPLGIGKVLLDDGALVNGFICEAYAIDDAEDITHLGNWRDYIATKTTPN